MRIRAIKPEFWTHTVMSRLPHDSRLMAIALLNLSDDEGYFEADIEYIRASVMFREESTNVRRMIDDLSRIGYIELCFEGSDRPIGKVVAFADHQRIDRPKPSKLKGLWIDDQSTTNRRTLDDQSRWKGREGNREEREKESAQNSVNLPAPKQATTTIPTVEEVIACGQMIGLGSEDCRQWHADRTAEGWADANGITIGNWRRWLTGYRDRLRVAPKNKPQSADSSFWKDSKRLELVEREIKQIRDRSGTDQFGVLTVDDKTKEKFNRLLAERKELKGKLGL